MTPDSRNDRGWRLVLRVVAMVAVFMAVLFVPAGRLDWLEGWLFLGAYLLAIMALYLWMQRHDPELAAERARSSREQQGWDRAILTGYNLLLVVEFVVASLDAGRFGWSDVAVVWRIVGWVGLSLAMALVWWVLATNTFASQTVRIQSERDHQVVDTGPYAVVRHPMYVGVIICFLCIPLVLRSLWALLPAGGILGLFVLRTIWEDRTLRKELPGYQAYAARVPWRLLPHIW